MADAGSAKGEVTVTEPSRTQLAFARRVAESRATVPDVTLTARCDVTAAVAAQADLGAVVIRAAGIALREFPRVNGSYRDARFEAYGRVNVGIAIPLEAAVVVPTIFDADRKSAGEIARERDLLLARATEGSLRAPELAGATFTVWGLGVPGVTEFVPVINPPQAAALAAGAVRAAPVVQEGKVVAGYELALTLAGDHRVLHGADAGRFLARVAELVAAG